jgi:hypothetical protein
MLIADGTLCPITSIVGLDLSITPKPISTRGAS